MTVERRDCHPCYFCKTMTTMYITRQIVQSYVCHDCIDNLIMGTVGLTSGEVPARPVTLTLEEFDGK